MTERMCGTCKSWSEITLPNPMPIGSCLANLDVFPWFYRAEKMATYENEGQRCPLWQPKEAAENESN